MTRKEVIPMNSLMPEVWHVNAGSFAAQIFEECQTWLRHWSGPRATSAGPTMLINGVPILRGEALRRGPLNAAGISTDITIVATMSNSISLQY
jgi:hypothetical protein